MSLHTLAKHVQQKGRGKDQMLVHMTPREVQGLQALAKAHGGSLTVNPETGLAEAGFLEDILPVVAMAAATYFTAGAAAPALSAALSSSALAAGTVTTAGGIAAGTLAGAGVGGIGAAMQGKDVGQGALYGGIGGAIAGGMGAYGGGAEAVAGATPTPSPDVVNKVALDTAAGAQIPGASGAPIVGPEQLAGPGMPGGVPPSVPPSVPPGMPQQLAGPVSPSVPGGSIPAPEVPLGPNGSPVPPKGYALNEFGDAFKPAPQAPSYYSKLGSGIGDTATKGFIQAAPGIGADIGMNQQDMGMPGEEPYKSASTLSPNFQGYTPRQPKPYYQPQYTRYAASGGLMDAYQAGGPVERMSQMNTALNPQGGLYPQGMIDKTQYAIPTQRPTSMEVVDAGAQRTFSGGGSAEEKKRKQRANLTADRTLAAMSADQAGLAVLNNARYGANMTGAAPLRSSRTLGDLPTPVGAARGGLADLGGYSDGGRMLKGPGDGMSDSIPGIIGRKQPARLADGEFVIPADVVSHLGNGSTDAGAKRLYAMMDRARQARTGKKKQAPAINANKILSRVA
jgi:hypothetical protein